MGTGYWPLFPGGHAPDGSGSGNNTAGLTYEVSTAGQTTNTPKITRVGLLFDPTTDEHWMGQFQIPGDYVSGGILRGKVEATVNPGSTKVAKLKGGQKSVVDGASGKNLAFVAADISGDVSIGTTDVNLEKEFTITLTATDMAANRLCYWFLGRDADHASDTYIEGDLILTALNLEYTN